VCISRLYLDNLVSPPAPPYTSRLPDDPQGYCLPFLTQSNDYFHTCLALAQLPIAFLRIRDLGCERCPGHGKLNAAPARAHTHTHTHVCPHRHELPPQTQLACSSGTVGLHLHRHGLSKARAIHTLYKRRICMYVRTYVCMYVRMFVCMIRRTALRAYANMAHMHV